jgi:hypothetical protein
MRGRPTSCDPARLRAIDPDSHRNCRAAAVAVAAIDAKKLDRAAKAEDKRTPEQNLLVQALTLDHVGIPTAPLINNRFKPLLRRSQARPVEEELFV